MRREEENAGHRHQRLQNLILEELRTLLRDDVSDPALVAVRISAVVLSVDYRHARIHFVLVSPGVQRGAVEQALARACPFFRSRLADAIDMKRAPDLRFVLDGYASSNEGGATE
jgi:ribosome-binding factor A